MVGFDLIAANRSSIASVQAQYERARLSAAADAGLARAVHGLGLEGSTRWPIDGRPQTMAFGDVVLTVTVEDERGRIALNRADEGTLQRLFAAAGADTSRAQALAAAVEDWRDADDEARPGGAEAPDYAPFGIAPRNAHPLAIAAVSFGGASSVEALERSRELAGQRTAFALANDVLLIGRDLTVRVVARSQSGAYVRVAIVELTGDKARPYWIRYLQ
jgi:general secretion pathway protein K